MSKFFALLLLTTTAFATDPFGMKTVDEVSSQLGKPNFYVYDANSDYTFKNGHVPGATHIKFNKFSEDVLPKDKQATLVFYCQNPH